MYPNLGFQFSCNDQNTPNLFRNVFEQVSRYLINSETISLEENTEAEQCMNFMETKQFWLDVEQQQRINN